MATITPLKKKFPEAEIFWFTKDEFKPLISFHKEVNGIFTLNKKTGFLGLIKLAFKIRDEKFDLIYDAHANLRSMFLRPILGFLSPTKIIKRPKDRFKRLLLFWFRINKFPKPFRGIKSYLAPLNYLGVNQETEILKIDSFLDFKKWIPFETFIVLAPSAAWELKRWPIDYWKKLIELLPGENIVILGGPDDKFCKELENVSPEKCINLAGVLSFSESVQFVSKANLVISGDTGIIHIADLLGIKGILLMGPSAFGFTTGPHIKIMERQLECRPCTKDGRGKCSNEEYKKCLVDIRPLDVAYLASSWATKRS
jgi:heptosyltransferase-2